MSHARLLSSNGIPSVGSAAWGDGSESRGTRRQCRESTFDRVNAFFPEDLRVLEGKNATRKDCLEKQTLDVV